MGFRVSDGSKFGSGFRIDLGFGMCRLGMGFARKRLRTFLLCLCWLDGTSTVLQYESGCTAATHLHSGRLKENYNISANSAQVFEPQAL